MKQIIILPILVIVLLIKLTLTIQVYENIDEDTTNIPNDFTTVLSSTTTTATKTVIPSIITTDSPEHQATVVLKQSNDNKKTPTTYATRKPFQHLSTAVTKLHTMTTASFKHNGETTRHKYHEQQEQIQQKHKNYLVKDQIQTNNKKRQLFGKEKDKPVINNNITNITENGNEASSSKNTENNFIPSLQLTPNYSEYKTLSSNNYDNDFHPTNEYYKPIKFDTNYQFPQQQQYQHQEILQQPLHHREQHHYQHSPFHPIYNNGKQQEHQQPEQQQQSDINTNQQMQNEKTKDKWSETWQEPYENGKFVWVPFSVSKGSTSTTIPTASTTIASTRKPQLIIDEEKSNDNENDNKSKEEQMKYINGKWKWIADDSDNVEGKIITNFPHTPSYYEQIKIYQDYKPTITIKEPPPYSFKIANNNSPFNYHHSPHGYLNYDPKDYVTIQPTTTSSIATTSIATEPTKIKDNDNDDDDYIKPIHPISPWKKIIHVLTAAIPIGLIISALTPHVVYINPNTTDLNGGQQTQTFQPGGQKVPTLGFYPGRQRSLDNIDDNKNVFNTETLKQLLMNRNLEELINDSREDVSTDQGTGRGQLSNPLMDFLNIFGDDHNYEHSTSCDDRIFCEMSRMGIENDSDVLYKMLWRIANETTIERAQRSGLGDVFKAIRENRCFIYKCESLDQKNRNIKMKINNRRKSTVTKKQPKEINF